MARPSLRTRSTGADEAPTVRRTLRPWLAALTTTFTLAGTALNAGPLAGGALQAAEASSSPPLAPVEQLVNQGAQSCGIVLASRYGVDPASVDIWLTPGLRIAIESGEIGEEGILREGLQFGWMLRGRPAPAPIGLCRTRGNGSVATLEEQKD